MAKIDRSRIAELMEQAEGLQRGSTQVGLLEEAVRLADLLADLPLAYDARMKLIEAANFGGTPEKSLAAFSWCLAQLDRNPGRFDEYAILWSYKWVIRSLPCFSQIPRSQIMLALADFATRIERAGFGMRPIYKLQLRLALRLGDFAEFHAAHERWSNSLRGEMSDCIACDRDDEVEYLIESGRDEDSLAEARPILNGAERCAMIPHCTYAKLLLPLVRLGRLGEAGALHLKGYRMVSRNPDFLCEVSQHLGFLALTDNLAKGLKLFEAHLPWGLRTFDQLDRFRFSLASSFLFKRLATSGKDSVRLHLPESFAGYQPSGRYVVADLARWLDSDIAGLARRFDERNGNDSYAAKIEASQEWHHLVTPYSVKKSRKSNTDPAN